MWSKRPGEQTMLLLTLINYLDGQLGFVDGRLGQIAGLDGDWRIKVNSNHICNMPIASPGMHNSSRAANLI